MMDSGDQGISKDSSSNGRATGTCVIELPSLVVGVADGDADRRQRVTRALALGGLDVVAHDAQVAGLIGNGTGHIDAAVVGAAGLGPAELEAIALLREALPETKIVAVAGWLAQKSTIGAIEAGVAAVVVEDRLEEALVLAVRAACAGQLSLPYAWRAHVGRPVLSIRQKQILGMVVLGFTNSQIARKLYVAETTVKSHLSSAFRKLGVRSRNEATALILDAENGLGTGILEITGADRARD